VGHAAHMGDEKMYKILVMKPEGKRPLECLSVDGKITLIWILKGTGCEDVDWIQLIQDRVQWEYFRTSGLTKSKEFLDDICDCQFFKSRSAPQSWLVSRNYLVRLGKYN
jgi:hypothetical protein